MSPLGRRNPSAPLITVVMATLNAAHHLSRSLGSLLEQSLRDFEVVLVDGGSHDQTPEKAAKILAEGGIRYRILIIPGLGIYGAINCGVADAQGDWIFVMGADDRINESRVFSSMAPHLLGAGRAVLVVHGDVWIEDPGYRYGQPWDLPRFLDRNISHQSAFYCRRKVQRWGVKYDEKYALYADWDYNLNLFARGKFSYVPLLVASYACTGASSQREDAIFLAEKEKKAREYFGWRSIFLMPPFRFSMACGERPGLLFHAQFLLNRMVWSLKRVGMSRPVQLSS